MFANHRKRQVLQDGDKSVSCNFLLYQYYDKALVFLGAYAALLTWWKALLSRHISSCSIWCKLYTALQLQSKNTIFFAIPLTLVMLLSNRSWLTLLLPMRFNSLTWRSIKGLDTEKNLKLKIIIYTNYCNTQQNLHSITKDSMHLISTFLNIDCSDSMPNLEYWRFYSSFHSDCDIQPKDCRLSVNEVLISCYWAKSAKFTRHQMYPLAWKVYVRCERQFTYKLVWFKLIRLKSKQYQYGTYYLAAEIWLSSAA
jgi:hypothetical protein